MIRSRRLARLATFAALTSWPAAAQACAVCFSGSPRIRIAFFNTTILLSLLPLAMILGGLWYLRRVGKVRLAEEFTESDYSLPVPPDPAPSAPAVLP